MSTQKSIKNGISNSVINALLEAFYDILDLDGKRSILCLAGLPQLMEAKLNSSGNSDWVIFEKLLDAMRNSLTV